MEKRKDRLRGHDDAYGPVFTTVNTSIILSDAERYRKAQGVLRRFGHPNSRDHSLCNHKKEHLIMPEVAERVVGSKNRSGTSKIVEFLFNFPADLLDEDGDWYETMILKGITLRADVDYRILTQDGDEAEDFKSGPEKVRDILKVVFAEELNCTTVVAVPDNGSNVATSDRDWVMFRPRPDKTHRFTSDEARAEYITNNQRSGTSYGVTLPEDEEILTLEEEVAELATESADN